MTYPTYEKYKDSGVDWLGEIPAHWEACLLKRVANASYGVGGELDRTITDGVRILSLPNVKKDGNLDLTEVPFVELNDNEKNGLLLKEGDLLFNWRNGSSDHLGKTAYFNLNDAEYTHVSFLLRIRLLNNENYAKYFHWLINGFRETGYFQSSKAGVNNTFNLSELTNLWLILPSPKEQRAIADFLDRETGRIDRLIAKKQRLIELLQEKRTALISHAVTKGLNPAAPMKDSGIPWLGEIPAYWEVKRLKFVASLKSGEGITSAEIEENGNYPIYGGNGLRGYVNKFSHEGQYILIGRQGALCGNINYAIGKFWASEHAVVITIEKGYDYIWLGELLRIMNLNQYSISAAQPGLAVDRIQNLYIPVPPIDEQRKLREHIETNQSTNLNEKINQAITKLLEYRTALISAAVTGKIKVS